jgi:hypothetical protein
MGSPQEDAIELKNKGNAAFKAHDWAGAVDFYTQAIDKYDKDPSFYTNRAQVCSLPALHATMYLRFPAGKHQVRIIRPCHHRCRQGP